MTDELDPLEALAARPKATKGARHERLRRESRPDNRIGAFVEAAAAEADNRVLRAVAGPPPTEAEQMILAESRHEPVKLFTRVLVTDIASGEQEAYTVVPHDEADLERGRISIGSPIGRALLEEYPGAVVVVKTPVGKRLYRILRVTPPGGKSST